MSATSDIAACCVFEFFGLIGKGGLNWWPVVPSPRHRNLSWEWNRLLRHCGRCWLYGKSRSFKYGVKRAKTGGFGWKLRGWNESIPCMKNQISLLLLTKVGGVLLFWLWGHRRKFGWSRLRRRGTPSTGTRSAEPHLGSCNNNWTVPFAL